MIVSSPFLRAACQAANWKVTQATTALEALKELYVNNVELIESAHPALKVTRNDLNGKPASLEDSRKAKTLLDEMRQYPADFLWIAEQLQTPKIADRAQKIKELNEVDLAELLLDQWQHQQRLYSLEQRHGIGSIQEVRSQYLTWMLLNMESLHRAQAKATTEPKTA